MLLVRLPCNPIFPIGPVYLADHLHKQFPGLAQQILDLAAVPLLDVEAVLLELGFVTTPFAGGSAAGN